MKEDKGTAESASVQKDDIDAGMETTAAEETEPAEATEATRGGAVDGDVGDGHPVKGDVSVDDDAKAESSAEARFEELSERYVRLVADFDNFRRRTRANEQHIREQAAANLIKELLPVIDNLQLALSNVGEGADDGFVQGIQLIEQQLLAALHNHGLRPLETAGQPFDPRTMEAVAQIDAGGQTEPGHVVEELRRGYMLHDVVLRAAQVVVAQQD